MSFFINDHKQVLDKIFQSDKEIFFIDFLHLLKKNKIRKIKHRL